MKILILGGYGVFGGRLAELLLAHSNLELLICGRTQSKAEAFCAGKSGAATLTPIALDRKDIAAALAAHQPDLLVDASGPFQDYGDDPYFVVQACIDHKVPYMDFADAADFVFGVSAFDEAARQAGIYVLSGVSSFPVLTSAVLRRMSADMTIKSVTGGIAPSPYAGIGMNVMRAVISYAGGPVKLTRNGQPFEAKGLTESLRYTVAPPGFLPLRNLHYSLVDVPDLQVLPRDIPSIENIWMGAGPIPEILHRMLNLLAKFRAAIRLPSFERLAPLFYRILNLMKFGEHRGGMFVEAIGERGGKPVTKSWHLLAEGDDGPYIPSMAVEAIVLKLLSGEAPEPGARPATRALKLSDYEDLFEGRTIYTGMREDVDGLTAYQQVLGSAFDDLPTTLQTLHGSTNKASWSGASKVTRGTNPLARLLAAIIGFPPENSSTPVTVTFTPDAKGELWERNFGDKTFSSYQAVGTARNAHMITERFGPFTLALAMVVKETRLHIISRRWTFLGLPLPKILMPGGNTFEFEDSERFNFDVEIRVPMIGLIVAYKGWLTKDA